MASFDQRDQDVITQYNADRITIYTGDRAVKDDQFWRNRSQMLEKVRLIWIKGLLEPSLDQLARIELGLEPNPDAVDRPFDLLVQRPAQAPHPLPMGTPISHIFDEEGKALLILGEPEAGKTTLLLELTRDLLHRAEQNEHHLIPVVFNLSSWAEHRLALADWLVDELNKRYDVPRKLAHDWVDDNLLLPLLDGLDEVAADHREACLETINAFIHEHGLLPLVVCSRVKDYAALTGRLRLPSAVLIQLLSRQQVQHYVEQAGTSLAGLHAALHDDETLWELLNTPLMLNIMALAYRGRSAEEIRAIGTLEERRRHVFAAYTDAMFHRHAPAAPYTREQTERWLTWLARAMEAHDQSVFYLEWMQPDWLPGQKQQRLVTFITLVMSSLLGGLLSGLLGGLLGGLLFGLFLGLYGGLLSGLLGGWGLWQMDAFTAGKFETQSFPNEEIRRFVRNALLSVLYGGLFFGLGRGLFFGLFSGLLSGLFSGLLSGLFSGLLSGLLGGLFFGLHFGGYACLHHFALRLVLWHNNLAPLHYVRFLDYAAARIFLYKVGGGYVFVHRKLLEYFASMHQTAAE